VSGAGAAIFVQQLLAAAANCVGEIAIATERSGFALCHRDDRGRSEALQLFTSDDDALELARYDDGGRYRPLKTAPNLRHGWRLIVADPPALCRALEIFYPGRIAALAANNRGELETTPLRNTLERQSGMYRIAAQITDTQLDELVGTFCRSDGGCLRTILWKRDFTGTAPSTLLPHEKFDPEHDQTGRNENAIPLLCQEACNLLVNATREVVKSARMPAAR
jgi:sirohydrochlorin cobaltochelatase